MASVGEFLRHKRAKLLPEAVLGRTSKRRRTPGLRREEVAELAGVSVDWYARLEQDRALAPSLDVLEAVSRALRLTAVERRYLFRLARGEEPPLTASAPAQAPSLSAALAAFTEHPALVVGGHQDVLATNALAERLFLGFSPEGRFARNGPWFVLCDERARSLYPDYAQVARETVGALRSAFARSPNDARFQELVAELSSRSQLFVSLWSEQYVSDKTPGRKRFSHAYAGLLDFDMHGLTTPDAPDQLLLLYVPRDEATRLGLARLREPRGSNGARRRERPRRSVVRGTR